MGMHTEHNWRARSERVVTRRISGPDVTRRVEFCTERSERCSRCGCLRTRISGGRGLEPWVYPSGFEVMPRCAGRVVS